MAVRTSRIAGLYGGQGGDPYMAQAVSNIAALFAAPSGSDIANAANAQATNAKALRDQSDYDYAADPNYDPALADRRLLGNHAYAWDHGREQGLMNDTTARRGQDVTAATARANNTADNARAFGQTLYGNLGVNDTRPAVPESVAGRYGYPAMPAQIGVLKQGQGDQLTLPSGQIVAGPTKPLTQPEWQAAQSERLRQQGTLTDDDLVNTIMSGVPNTTVQTPNGPRIMPAPQAGRTGAAPMVGRPMSQTERQLYQVPDGTPASVDEKGVAHFGGGGVTVNNNPGENELNKTLGEATGKQWASHLQNGVTAANSLQDLDMLDELSKVAPQGALTGRLAQAFPGMNSAADAYNSIISRVAPTLHVPGSGSQSDIEYQGVLNAMPGLTKSPAANAAISQMMRSKAQLNMQRAQAVQDYQNSGRTAADQQRATRALAALDHQSVVSPELKSMLGSLGGVGSPQAAPAPAPGGAPATAAGPDRAALEAEARRRGLMK